MSGCYNGCQAIIKADYPLALYVHCGAYMTNLIASAASSSAPFILNGMQLVQDLGNFYRSSSTFRLIFSSVGDALCEDAENSSCSLKTSNAAIQPIKPTRWLTRCSTIQSVITQYKHVLNSLENAASSLSGETGAKACGLHAHFLRSQTLLCLKMVLQPLTILENLNKSLRSKHATVSRMLSAIDCVKTELCEMRSESVCKNIIDLVEKEADEPELYSLALPRRNIPSRLSENPTAHHAQTLEGYYRPKYFQFIDTIITQLNERCSYKDLKTYNILEIIILSKDVTFDAKVILDC